MTAIKAGQASHKRMLTPSSARGGRYGLAVGCPLAIGSPEREVWLLELLSAGAAPTEKPSGK